MEPVFYTIDNFIHNLSQIKYITINYKFCQTSIIDKIPCEKCQYHLHIYYDLNEDKCIQHTFFDNEDDLMTLVDFLSYLTIFRRYGTDAIYEYLKKIKSMYI